MLTVGTVVYIFSRSGAPALLNREQQPAPATITAINEEHVSVEYTYDGNTRYDRFTRSAYRFVRASIAA